MRPFVGSPIIMMGMEIRVVFHDFIVAPMDGTRNKVSFSIWKPSGNLNYFVKHEG